MDSSGFSDLFFPTLLLLPELIWQRLPDPHPFFQLTYPPARQNSNKSSGFSASFPRLELLYKHMLFSPCQSFPVPEADRPSRSLHCIIDRDFSGIIIGSAGRKTDCHGKYHDYRQQLMNFFIFFHHPFLLFFYTIGRETPRKASAIRLSYTTGFPFRRCLEAHTGYCLLQLHSKAAPYHL